MGLEYPNACCFTLLRGIENAFQFQQIVKEGTLSYIGIPDDHKLDISDEEISDITIDLPLLKLQDFCILLFFF